MRTFLYLIAAILASIQFAFAAIDINTATESELDKLPGIGPTKAKAIIEDRKKNGPFRSTEDLKRVKGIGDKTFDELKSQITAGGAKAASTPAKPSLAPAATTAAPAAARPAGSKPAPLPAPAGAKPAATPAAIPVPAGAKPASGAGGVPVPAGLKPPVSATAAPATPPVPAGAKPSSGKPAGDVPKPAGAVPAPAGAKAAAESAGKKDDRPAEKK